VIVAPDTSPPMATLPQSASISFLGLARLFAGRRMQINEDRPDRSDDNGDATADPAEQRTVAFIA
jgi:hypothetical protein